MNFLALDDLLVTQEGESVDPLSVIEVPHYDGYPVFPAFSCSTVDPFVLAVNASHKKWVIFTDTEGAPSLVMNANEFLRAVFFAEGAVNPRHYCHYPVIVRDTRMLLGSVLSKMMTAGAQDGSDEIKHDLVLVWSEHKLVITGSDILGRLLRGAAPSSLKLAFP